MIGKDRLLRYFCAFLVSITGSTASAMDGYQGESAMYSAEKPLSSTALGGATLLADSRSISSLSFEPFRLNNTSFANAVEGALQFNLTQRAGGSYLHMGISEGAYATNRRVGTTWGRAYVSLLHGDGDGMSPDRQGINAMAGNYFHGAPSRPYAYTGAALAYAWTDRLASHAGSVSINAPEVDTRAVHYAGASYGGLAGSYYTVDRGGVTVGSGIALSLALKSVELGYRELDSRNQASWHEVSAAFKTNGSATYRLSLGAGSSGLYEAAEDTRVTLTYQIPLSGRKQRSGRATGHAFSGNSGLSMAATMFDDLTRRSMGAVGVGLMVSSGDPIMDAVPRFTTQPEAAYVIMALVNPVSVSENLEYGGSIFRNPDGTYSPTELIVRGTEPYQIAFNPHLLVPPGTRATAAWHTHGAANPAVITELFSPTDLQFFQFYQVDGYLGTPMGRFWEYERATNMIYLYVAPDGNEFILPH